MAFRQAESDTPSENERLERIARHAAVGLFEVDADGALLFATERALHLFGLPREGAIGARWLDALGESSKQLLERRWFEAVTQAAPLEFHAPISTGAPSRTARIRLSPILRADGSLSGFAGAISDITASTSAEQGAADRFRVVAEAMPQLAWIAAPDGTIEYFNQPWLEYTGVTVERMQHAGGKGVVHPDDLQMTWKRWSGALKSGQPYEIQYRLRSVRDGTYRWFIARALPIRDDAGHIVNWIGTATDIDAQVRANDNLRFMLEATNALASLLDVRQICGELAALAISRIADSCFITMVNDRDACEVLAAAHREGTPAEDREPLQSLAAGPALDAAIQRNVSSLLPSFAGTSARVPDTSARVHSMMVVPLAHRGTTFGAITLLSTDSARTFTGEDLAVVQMVAQGAAIAIGTARAYETERQRAARLRFIAHASEMLFESFELENTLNRVTELLVSQVADFAAIFTTDGKDGIRTASAAYREARLDEVVARLRGQRIFRPAAEDRVSHFLGLRAARIFRDLSVSAISGIVWEYLARDIALLDVRTAIAVPLYSRGETFGALVVCWSAPDLPEHDDDLPLLEDLGRRLSIAIEHARTLERERRIAQALQSALLPQPGMLPVTPGLTFDAEYRPSSNEADVGGDWYDALTLPDGAIAISVGDVTGRGLRAAGLMGKLRQALGMASLYETDPARILDLVDFSLRSRGSSAIATAFIGIISPDRTRLRYASAGHPPPLLRRGGDVLVDVVSDGLPLGLRDADREQSKEISLDGAQMLLLYTDGLTEATRDLAFGERRLRAIAGSAAILYVRSAARFVCDACLPMAAQDDTAVLTVRFGMGTQWSFDAENAQAAHEARTQLIAYLREKAEPGSDFEAAELVFGELVGNVVRHAPGPIDVKIDWTGAYPMLHVIDRGKGVVRNPSLPKNPLSESGRGLYIISLLTRSLRVERIPGYGNHIAAELNLQRR